MYHFSRMIFIYSYILMLKGGKPKCNMNEKTNTNDYVSEESTKSHPPLIAKWRNGVKLQLPGKFDGEGKLYLNICIILLISKLVVTLRFVISAQS